MSVSLDYALRYSTALIYYMLWTVVPIGIVLCAVISILKEQIKYTVTKSLLKLKRKHDAKEEE